MAIVETKAGFVLGDVLGADSPRRLMSQAELARAVGVKQPSVSAWVAMTARPEAHYRRAIRRTIAAAAAEKGIEADIPEDDWMTDAERSIADGVPTDADATGPHVRASNDDVDAAKPTGTS